MYLYSFNFHHFMPTHKAENIKLHFFSQRATLQQRHIQTRKPISKDTRLQRIYS